MDNKQNQEIDAENYKGQQNYGYREIVLKQVQRITNIYSKELTESFWKRTQPNNMGSQEVVAYIPDGRLSYIQAVQCLHDLLLPKFDEPMKKDAGDIEKKTTDTYDSWKKESEEGKKRLMTEWYNEKVKYLRQMFQKLCLFLERLGWLEEDSEGED